MKIDLPHQRPILFFKSLIANSEHSAQTKVEFPYPPTLAMMIEAAAQSSAFVKVTKEKEAANIPLDCAEGMLIGLKKVVLHQAAKVSTCSVHIVYSGNLENFFSFDFEVLEGKTPLASGTLNVILTCTKELV